MDKNTVIGLVLIAAIFFGFTFYQNKQAAKQAAFLAQQDSIALARQAAADSIAAAEAPAVPAVPVVEEITAETAPIYKDSSLNVLHGGSGTIVTLENDKMVLELTSKGAQPYSVKIKDYYNHDSTDLTSSNRVKRIFHQPVYRGIHPNQGFRFQDSRSHRYKRFVPSAIHGRRMYRAALHYSRRRVFSG